MTDHSMRWKLFHEMNEYVLTRNDMISERGTIARNSNRYLSHNSKDNKYNKIPILCLLLTQHGLRACHCCRGENRPLLAK